jgi:hypothetical protein
MGLLAPSPWIGIAYSNNSGASLSVERRNHGHRHPWRAQVLVHTTKADATLLLPTFGSFVASKGWSHSANGAAYLAMSVGIRGTRK